jgi:hypothetical protein
MIIEGVLGITILKVLILSVFMLIVIMRSAFMLKVVMPGVIILNVFAPHRYPNKEANRTEPFPSVSVLWFHTDRQTYIAHIIVYIPMFLFSKIKHKNKNNFHSLFYIFSSMNEIIIEAAALSKHLTNVLRSFSRYLCFITRIIVIFKIGFGTLSARLVTWS